MPEPWQCPACKTWLAPHVREHRCAPEDGVGAVRPAPAPAGPSTTVSTWPTGGVSTTTGTQWTATNVTMTFDGQKLAEGVRSQLLSYQRRNPRGNLRAA